MAGNVKPGRIKRKLNLIPLNLITEILLRLPVSSIVRFRCVCKLWFSITHDPHFIDTHLQRARNTILIFVPFYRVIHGKIPVREREGYNITVLDRRLAPKPFLTKPNPNIERLHFNRSCNGLFCISTAIDEGIQLFNPATGESLTPPNPTRSIRRYRDNAYLGFHPETKEYKVIRFFHKSVGIGCEVYTLGTISWREICTLDYRPAFSEHEVTLKGTMYWIVYQFRTSIPKVKYRSDIVSFDLKDESFTPVSPPNYDVYEGEEYAIGSLLELRDNLCISVHVHPHSDHKEYALDVWMLDNGHRTEHQWARKYSIIIPRTWPHARPLLVDTEKVFVHGVCNVRDPKDSNSDYILDLYSKYLSDGAMLQCHHLEGGSHKEIYRHSDQSFMPFVYVESLVPLRNW